MSLLLRNNVKSGQFQISNFKFQISNKVPKFNLDKILIFLLILFLPSQLGKHYWPDFSFVNSIRIDYYSPTIYFWDLILILTTYYFFYFRKVRINKKALGLCFFFILFQTFSLFLSSNIGAGLVRLEQLLISCVFGVLIASLNIKSYTKEIYWGLVLGVLFESTLSVFQFMAGHSLGLWILGERAFSLSTISIATFNYYGEIFLRPYGTFPHPNVMSAFMILTIPLIYFLGKGYKAVTTEAIIAGSLATLLSFSRGSILLLGIEILFFLRKRLRLLVIILFLTIPFLFVRFNSAFNFDILSLERREDLAVIAIEQFRTSPFLGIGINGFINVVAESGLVSGPTRFLQPVHNIFLLTMTETGIIGLLGILGLLGYPIYLLFRKQKSLWRNILLFEFLVILGLGMIDHYFLTLPQGMRVLFLIWGLSMLEYSGGDIKKGI